MKVLYISNISSGVGSFSIANIMAANELGIDFHLAANYSEADQEKLHEDEMKYGVKLHQIDFIRNPFHPKNLIALFQTIKLINKERFDVIHCNTPIGGVVGRLAGKKCGVKKILYQAHGFHFYKGAPLRNWLFFYPIERFLARYTDGIITINNEDYERAQKFKLRNKGKVYFVPGVGINLEEYETAGFNRELKRKAMGLSENDIAIISAGDLIERKNYKVSLEAIAKANDSRIHYYICGKGPLHKELEDYAIRLNIRSHVHFLGFRSDVKELMWASDIFLFTTLQEGLPRSLSEAMASGLPCIASKIRGNVDLLEDGISGFLCSPTDSEGFARAIIKITENKEKCAQIRENSLKRIKEFDVSTVTDKILNVYKEELI